MSSVGMKRGSALADTDRTASTSGQILNAEAPSWVQVQEWDASLDRMVDVYYFWVRNRVISPAVPFRKLDGSSVARILTSPTSADVAWIAPVASNSFLISGI